MPVWEQVLIVIAIIAVLFLLGPRAKTMMEESRNAENPDWKGAIIPLVMVVGFVILLIAMVRS
ncbi:MAG: hypothetical protein HND53_11550 [Proteobacteria bacterium]|nr:hypothetical protein [Pseudomonadota bacterium]NOG61127.1 hypothetical protein [Pseudomonadota bacterium]